MTMRFDHARSIASETTPLLVPPASSEELQQRSQQRQGGENKPHFEWNEIVWVVAAIWSAVFLSALDGTIVATLMTPIGSYFEQSYKAPYIGTSYLLSVCCFTPLYGRLADILGRKVAMLLALALFTFGTLLCGIAPSMETLIAARAIAGMGGGGVMIVTSVIATDMIPLKNRGLFQGMSNVLFGAGAGLGGPLGGLLNDTIGWRAAFLLQLPCLTLSSLLVAIHVNIPLPQRPLTLRQKLARVDWLGSITLASAVGSLLLGLTLKSVEEFEWSDIRVCGLLVGSVVSCIAFVVAETWISQEPVMPMRILCSRTPLAVAISNFLFSVCGLAMMYNVPLYFAAVKLESATESGLHLLPHSVAISLGSVVIGMIMKQTGKYWTLTVISATLMLSSNVLISFWDEKRTSNFELWFDIVPNGFGISSITTTTLIAVIAGVSRADMAIATGMIYLFRTAGAVVGVSLSGALVQGVLVRELKQRITGPGADKIIDAIRHSTNIIPTLDPPLRHEAVQSYSVALRVVFLCQTAVAFLMLLACLPIEEHPLQNSHHEHEASHRERQVTRTQSEPAPRTEPA